MNQTYKIFWLNVIFAFTASYLSHAQGQQSNNKLAPPSEINFTEWAEKSALEPRTPRAKRPQIKKTFKQEKTPISLQIRAEMQDLLQKSSILEVSNNEEEGDRSTTPTASASFKGITDDPIYDYPVADVGGAVGPNHIVATTNSEYRILSKTGTLVNKTYAIDFWKGTLPNGNLLDPFDPKCYFDPFGKRWILVSDAFELTKENVYTDNTHILIAISKGEDPTAGWYRYAFDTDSDNSHWLDFPNVGFNKQWITISGNSFTLPFESSFFTNSSIFVFDKQKLYNGDASGFIKSFDDDMGASFLTPAPTYDDNVNTQYMLTDWDLSDPTGGYLRIFTLTGTLTNPIFTPTEIYPTALKSGSYFPIPLLQKGTRETIEPPAASLSNVLYKNGSLWFTNNVFQYSPERTSVWWWQINPIDGMVLQHGQIDDPTGVKSYAHSSIAVDKYNNVMVGHSIFTATQYPSAGYSYRAAADAYNTLRPANQYITGKAKYYRPLGGRNRWGDFSTTIQDPTDDKGLWTVQQYTETASGGKDRWATQWAKIPTTITCPAPATPTMSNLNISSAKINWLPVFTATNYKIEYRKKGVTTWTSATSTTNSFSITGLTANTEYEARITTTCSTLTSLVSPTVAFKTASCNTIIGTPTTSYTTATSTKVDWVAFGLATGYKVEYKKSTATTWSNIVSTNNIQILTNLSPNTAYNVRIYTNCEGNTSSTNPSATVNFTTQTCPSIPNKPSVSSITTTGARIAWSPQTGASSYLLEYKKSTATTWIPVTTNVLSIHTLNNLSAATTYHVRVTSLCSGVPTTPTAFETFTTKTVTAAKETNSTTNNEIENNEITYLPYSNDINMTLVPNPADDNLNINIIAANASEYQLSIQNLLGQVIDNKQVTLENGYNIIQLSTSSWQKGQYAVLLQDKNAPTKLVKLLLIAH